MPSGFESFDHTADVGYRVWGDTLEELFSAGLSALYDAALSSEWREDLGARLGSSDLRLSTTNLADLFHDWLQRALFLLDTEGAVVQDIRFQTLTESALSAEFVKVAVPAESRSVEIKAVTYHQLAVDRSGPGWSARVIFDL